MEGCTANCELVCAKKSLSISCLSLTIEAKSNAFSSVWDVFCVFMHFVFTQEVVPPSSHTGFSGLHLPFVGFTYTTDR